MLRRVPLSAVVVLTVLLASCSSDPDPTGAPPATTGPTTSDESGSPSGSDRPVCNQGATTSEVEAAEVDVPEGEPRLDLDVTSADGTVIRAHWFPAAGLEATDPEPVPTVLMGPGWSLPGDVSSEGAALFGALGIGPLNDAGYNVLTWDPRGFGGSGGEATVNHVENEGRDVQVLLDWVSAQPGALVDGEGDPRVGMIGASYGGGIQLTVAAADCRVDALVPNMAWNSLSTSLYPQETVKAGWAQSLVTFASAASLDPHIVSAAETGIPNGTLSDADREWFIARGPGDAIADITTPTLLVHGTVDTLFTLNEGLTLFEALDDGDDVALLLYCGGHGTCLTDPGDPDLVAERTRAWLDHHLLGADTDTGPRVDVLDQHGRRWTGDVLAEADGMVSGTGDGGVLALDDTSKAGPLPEGASSDLLSGLVGGFTPARAEVAVEATVTADDAALVLGQASLRLAYEGTSPDGERPTRVFAQLIDDASGHVLGNQITPVPVVLDGTAQTVEVDLEAVVHHLEAGESVTVQLVATTPAFAPPRLGGEITFTSIELDLPTTTALTLQP